MGDDVSWTRNFESTIRPPVLESRFRDQVKELGSAVGVDRVAEEVG